MKILNDCELAKCTGGAYQTGIGSYTEVRNPGVKGISTSDLSSAWKNFKSGFRGGYKDSHPQRFF